MIARNLVLLLALAELGGCATDITVRRRAGLDYFVGRTGIELVEALGQPSRTWRDHATEYIAYDYTAQIWFPGESGVRTPDAEATVAPWLQQQSCETSFRVVGNRVSAWRLDGNGCTGVPFPNVKHFAARYMAKAQSQDVVIAMPFLDNPFNGSSSVNKGEFYSQ